MPKNEKEIHPYLSEQIKDLTLDQKAKYCKLIVGTFPIYEISASESSPSPDGIKKRDNWNTAANFQYFYGSKKSRFWSLLSYVFNEETPNSKENAITLLDKHQFIITDVYEKIYRNEYSSDDSDILEPTLNQNIRSLLEQFINVKIIYFTSKEAKLKFCSIFKILFSNEKDSYSVINNRKYRLIVLITPALNARSAPHYFKNFLPTNEEAASKKSNLPYALNYRKRYYKHYLTLPCN